VIHEDNLDLLRPRGMVVPWTFANNICRQIRGASEFAAEHDGEDRVEGFPQEDRGVVIRSNLLEKSFLAMDVLANFSGDPLFVDAGSSNFRLAASSPAVDRGENRFSEGLSADLDGGCRRAAVSCTVGGALYTADLGAYELQGSCQETGVEFLRADCNMSDTIELTDAVFTFSYLFLGGAAPRCSDACDSDDSGNLGLTDGIYTLTYLFLGGPRPPAPGMAGSGFDPTCDPLPACR
jgi:hypothetical protein